MQILGTDDEMWLIEYFTPGDENYSVTRGIVDSVIFCKV